MFRVPKITMPAATSTTQCHHRQKNQTCTFTNYECSQKCLDGYAYCKNHILQDPNAPYKQCTLVYTNGRKCTNPKLDRKDIVYCPEHTKKSQLAKSKSLLRNTLPPSPEIMLLNLSHYSKPDNEQDDENKILDPFNDIDASKINSSCCNILDYASSSDSDVEPTMVNEALKGAYLDDSDNESVNSPQDDPLKHAGIFTAEEVIYIAREKLIKLQTLYIEQFRRLQYTLREKRRKYLQAIKKEKETYCSIHDQPKESAKEKKVYNKLKALHRYHRRNGIEAILYRKSLERRAKITEGVSQKLPSIPKCIFTEGGVKCGERTLPSAKHCRKHILTDDKQVLFKACGAVRADIECHEPVPVIFHSNCVYHMDLPTACKLEPMKFTEDTEDTEEKPKEPTDSLSDVQSVEIDVVGETQEIDPDDDVAGLMREMNDSVNSKQPLFSESVNSENSTDTAFSLTTQLSDKDDLVSTSS
ncbi:KAT8 regulatory NSL complex subunit 2 isoform X2 [Aphidius gifuensis]|uniref:KAT8 regulatory NSL complex subunit 2 isoform X2 n=1 Tax=Aphidius gifuensis TaxID=684658 RepID=UPI001CDCFBB3|nr:KAT8 regulatory NSL complex subunit 2 isoform X2 [Aphidius gifuensis]